MRINAPFAWFGGKAYLAAKIAGHLPAHQTYVEVFGGAASVLLCKTASPVEVYNDVNGGLVNFFRVLRNPHKRERLIELCLLTPYSRTEYEWAKESWALLDDDVEQAHAWFLVARMCFGGIFGKGWGYNVGASTSGMARMVAGWLSAIEGLWPVSERLRKVQIECEDFRRIIQRYDSPQTCFYLDPPYTLETRSGGAAYANELTDADHADLVRYVLSLQGKAVISGYDTPIYAPLLDAGYERLEYDAHAHSAPRTKGSGLQGAGGAQEQTRTECLWIRPEQAVNIGLFE